MNRGAERAETLAEATGARAVGLEGLGRELLDADVLVTASAAPGVVVELELVERILAERGGRPIVLVDAGLPRNVDPAAASLAGVTLLDLDDVRSYAEAGLAERARAADAALQLVEEAVARHLGERVARQADPTVAALRAWADDVRRAELERYRGRLSGLTDRELEAVDALTRSLLGKLLHGPTLSLKEAAATPRGDRLAEAAAELFRLDP